MNRERVDRDARRWPAESGELRATIREARVGHRGLESGNRDHIVTDGGGEKGLAFSVGQEEARRGCRYLTAFIEACQPSNRRTPDTRVWKFV